MSTSKPTLIILGGMGPMSSVKLHEHLLLNSNSQIDQDYNNILHISYSKYITDRCLFLSNPNKYDNPGEQAAYLLENFTSSFKKSEKYNLGIPCNTFHSPAIFNIFTQHIYKLNKNINVINMIDETILYILQKKFNIVGLLSTKGTRKTKLYENLLKKNNIDLIMVNNQLMVDDLIFNKEYGIKSLSYANNYVKKKIKLLFDNIIASSAQCIILGCTELPLAFKYNSYKKIEIINPIEILAKKMISD